MNNPRVVVLGADGMLGHKLFQHLRRVFPGTVGTSRKDLARSPLSGVSLLRGADLVPGVDVMAFDRLVDLLDRLRPDVIVNCVGVIKQRDAAVSPIPSIAINALFPHRLAEAAAHVGARVIHFSTDCVFSGRTGHYSETDPSDAEDLYGKTKFLGEVAAPNAVTLRTSIIGRELTEHRSLLDWFLAQNGKVVRGYRRAIYSGITTNEMARVVQQLIVDGASLSGVFQVVSAPISKFDLLGLIRDAYRLAITIEPDDGEVCDRSMRGEKFHKATGWQAPPWPTMVRDLADDPTPYAEWGVAVPEC